MKKNLIKVIVLAISIVAICTRCFFVFRNGDTSSVDKVMSLKLLKDYDKNSTVDDIDSFPFGSYPQDDVSGKKNQPIEWVVLEKDEKEKKALVMSKYIIDNIQYNEDREDVVWEKCSLRTWLNDTFYNKAFTQMEKGMILETDLSNDDNVEYLTLGGKDTKDYIFALSVEEAHKYFDITESEESDRAIASYGTWFARQGKYKVNEKRVRNHLMVMRDDEFADTTEWEWGKNNHYYWLRSSGSMQDNAAVINPIGNIDTKGIQVGRDYIGVRPCMWIKY